MRQAHMLHPDMLAGLVGNFYPSLCTIQQTVSVEDGFGGTTTEPLTGHGAIPCRIAPAAGSRETKTPEQVFVSNAFHIALAGYYPGIAETMQAVVDSATYDIQSVQHDGNQTVTRLMALRVE